MIHGQLVSKSCSSFILLAHPNRSNPRGKIFVPGMINKGKFQTEKHKAKSMHHTKQPLLGKKVTVSRLPAQIKLLALLGTRCSHPSLLPAHLQSRKPQRSDYLCSCWFRCFGVHPNVCLKYEISPLLGDPRTVSVQKAVDISLFHLAMRLSGSFLRRTSRW